ncbi:hypothetical protein BD410DRAFT_274175 [Rickenella mellea]|uniref:Uncharacterized protein n=1 Tax=Rickenella mellea TaxID=50990 RepID=A0A4Y7PH98_9AGAM|nr:hypothetical protein BD410DRAFT_274175 [Rickenella mellea]
MMVCGPSATSQLCVLTNSWVSVLRSQNPSFLPPPWQGASGCEVSNVKINYEALSAQFIAYLLFESVVIGLTLRCRSHHCIARPTPLICNLYRDAIFYYFVLFGFSRPLGWYALSI